MELPTVFFHRYFAVIFNDINFSITNFVGIFQQKHSIDKYQRNPRWNMKNKKNKLCDDV
jgi:hypothetical protein